MRLKTERDPDTKRLERIQICMQLPEGFPEKYRSAILRATDQCAVKKAMIDPPEIEIVTL